MANEEGKRRVDAGECAQLSRALLVYPEPDLSDPDAVEKTIGDFFELCEECGTRPLISAMCTMLGTTRTELLQTMQGVSTKFGSKLAPASLVIIQKALQALESNWEQVFVNNGFSNPATGIFYAKNNYGYKDTTENITVKVDATELMRPKEIAAKYASAVPLEDVQVEHLPEPDAADSPE